MESFRLQTKNRRNRATVTTGLGLLLPVLGRPDRLVEVTFILFIMMLGAPEYADNYRDISYRDNLALSYRIDSRYYGFMIIVSYRILII